MNKDSKQIAKIYEAIQEIDFFTKEESCFDWQKFQILHWENFDFNSLNPEIEYFLESFEKIKENSPTKHGEEDVYEIVLHNKLKFHLHINYIQHLNAKYFIGSKIANAKIKNQNDALVNYEKHFKDIEDNEIICMIMFKDEEGRTDFTKKVGMSAKELFVTLKNALLDSMSNKGWNDLRAIGARVNMNEDKRSNFYKKLFQKFLSNKFPNIFEDNETEQEENLKIIFATK